jgi:hypothetical protein
MPNRTTFAASCAVVSLCFAAIACGDNQDPDGARQLWKQIHALEFHAWQRAPGYESRRASQAPHSDAVEIFVNDVVHDALAADQNLSSWPIGSMIVKEGWSGDELELIAVMHKREAGWYWAEYDADGEAAYSGAPSLCTGCHQSGADFVRAFGF